MTRPWALLLTGLLVLGGCSSFAPNDELGDSPTGPVFLVHGIWPDGDWWWTGDLARDLEAEGLEPIVVNYSCFVGGWLFGYGTTPPGAGMARFVNEAEQAHTRTDCQVPLRWNAVGYSAGTVVVTKAAEQGVRFQRVYFGGSPIPFWSGWLQEQLLAHRIGRLINYYSPLDLLVWASFGAGVYGYHGGGGAQSRIENRIHWRTHFTAIWNQERAHDAVVSELKALGQGPAHTCVRVPWYRRWFASAKRRLHAAQF